jgi:hypothetical protein
LEVAELAIPVRGLTVLILPHLAQLLSVAALAAALEIMSETAAEVAVDPVEVAIGVVVPVLMCYLTLA